MEKTFEFTEGQKRAISGLKEFIDSEQAKVFILQGYAGTGKTTLVKELIKILKAKEKSFKLLASTGRAAKILSNITEAAASTVHSEIYTYSDFNLDLENVAMERASTKMDSHGQLYLEFGLTTAPATGTVRFYIIDESSMIGDTKEKVAVQALFGSGRLLSDLLVYDAKGKFIFTGDLCQLPPVNETFSPALSAEYFRRERKIECMKEELTEIVRQDNTNDIILASQKIRKLYASCPPVKWAKFPLRGCRNITIFGDQVSMLTDYVKRIKSEGYSNATLICRSNKSCDQLTALIRPALGFVQPALQKGDLLLITQNNLLSNLMNGDLVEVTSIDDHREQRANLTFLGIEVKDTATQKIYSQLLIENILYQDQTNLTQYQQKELFMDYYERMRSRGIIYKKKPKTEQEKSDRQLFEEGMRKDIYLNALRAVFGFALTCHKAQGGEWEHVYLDIPRSLSFNPQQETYQWLYTAMTRAKKQLYLTDGYWLV
jgi:ATP-dependent exoDNAse (exonuclease V) alpha subunit